MTKSERYKTEVLRQIREIKELEPGEIDLEAEFVEDLGFDSLDLFELVANLEEEFEVPIPDEALADVRTVQDAIDVVDRMASEAADGAGEPADEGAGEPATPETGTPAGRVAGGGAPEH